MKSIIPSHFGQFITSKLEKWIPPKFHRWVLPALALILILILVTVLLFCFQDRTPAQEPVLCTVSVENLNVHKEHDADSSVHSQLPVGIEIEILEQITADGIQWGRIDKTKLPDGTKAKAGWINLEYVRFPGEEEPEIIETEPPAPVTEPVTVVLPDPDKGITVMGTVTTGKLNIRKGAGSQYEAFDSYLEGDRVEIQEIVIVDDTEWGFTGKGWVGMGYIRLDGSPVKHDAETNSEQGTLITDGSLKVLGYGVVDLGELNVRLGPGMEYGKATIVTKGVRYAYYQTEGEWVRIEDGWVHNAYFYVEGTTADDAVTGTVTTDDLNIRTGPGTSFKSNGTISNGAHVEVLGQVGDWGYTAEGWINMTHVEPDAPTYSTGTGTVTSGLNIRTEPNADSDAVDTYKEGDRVTITEVDGSWGKTDKGWVNLKYVDFD